MDDLTERILGLAMFATAAWFLYDLARDSVDIETRIKAAAWDELVRLGHVGPQDHKTEPAAPVTDD